MCYGVCLSVVFVISCLPFEAKVIENLGPLDLLVNEYRASEYSTLDYQEYSIDDLKDMFPQRTRDIQKLESDLGLKELIVLNDRGVLVDLSPNDSGILRHKLLFKYFDSRDKGYLDYYPQYVECRLVEQMLDNNWVYYETARHCSD